MQSKFSYDFKECIYNPNYHIYNDGRVYSLYIKKFMATVLSSGYEALGIRVGNKSKSIRIHRLVALHFVDNPDITKFNIVNHKDGNKLNNHYTNLEWTDAKTNTEHAIEIGLKSFSKQWRAVLQYDEDMNLLNEYDITAEASRQTGILVRSIQDCCKGISKFTKSKTSDEKYIWRFRDEKTKIECPEGGKEVPGWENYVVFRNGDIYSKFLQNFMCTTINGDGYEMISFKQKGVYKHTSIHILVGEAFLVKPEGDGLQINHINCIRNCNDVDNLEYVTVSENSNYMYTVGGRKDVQKKVFRIHPETKEITIFANLNTASKELNIPYSTLAAAVQGRNKFTAGFVWQYESDEIKEIPKSKIRKIERLNPITKEIVIFDHAKKAAESVSGMSDKRVHTACKNGKLYEQFYWKYYGEDVGKPKTIISYKIRKDGKKVKLTNGAIKVHKTDILTGNILESFRNAIEASKSINVTQATLRLYCESNQPYRGYIWKFDE